MMAGIFNAIGVNNRGSDAQRKKDLNRIKVAFEEYFSDKGFFPDDALMFDLNKKSNCGSSTVFAPYLVPWPCDPDGNPYFVMTEVGNRFRAVTNLKNTKDKDIPVGWYDRTNFDLRGLTINDVNYGVSSTNILWYEDIVVDKNCNVDICFTSNSSGGCDHQDWVLGCQGSYCYFADINKGNECTSRCKTNCCGKNCPK